LKWPYCRLQISNPTIFHKSTKRSEASFGEETEKKSSLLKNKMSRFSSIDGCSKQAPEMLFAGGSRHVRNYLPTARNNSPCWLLYRHLLYNTNRFQKIRARRSFYVSFNSKYKFVSFIALLDFGSSRADERKIVDGVFA